MAKRPGLSVNVGDELTYRFEIVRVDDERITVMFRDGTRHTIRRDNDQIEEVRSAPKPRRYPPLRDKPD